jgi:hypothetical protein
MCELRGWADSRSKRNNGSFCTARRWLEHAMEKMENKERFPLSHGTATAICMNLFTMFVAPGI